MKHKMFGKHDDGDVAVAEKREQPATISGRIRQRAVDILAETDKRSRETIENEVSMGMSADVQRALLQGILEHLDGNDRT